jgi:ABC-2 type transport system permease protein
VIPGIDAGRIFVLLRKEWLDLRRNYGALAPIALVTVLAMVLPFVVTFGIPGWVGEPLAEDSDLVRLGGQSGAPGWLSGEGRVQYFLLQQFLLLFLLTPITGAMALAAHAIVGEKQARTLEPLLATPVSTVELLVAKVLGALLPSLAISGVTLGLYLGGIAWLGEPGVAAAMLNARTAILALWVGPTASLVSLQSAILVSSRVNDARAAQQVGVLIIVPLTGLVVAQFVGAVWVTPGVLGLIGAGALALWMILVLVSIVLFQREAILTRWR